MTTYVKMICANKQALLNAYVTELLSDQIAIRRSAANDLVPINLATLEEILDSGAKFANDLGIKNGGMSSGQVEHALTEALEQAIAGLSARGCEGLANSLKNAFIAAEKESIVRGPR